MRVALSIFLALHGVAHLVGFVGPWGLVSSVPTKTALFAGRVPVGNDGMKAIGILWLLAALMFVVAGLGRLLDAPWTTSMVVTAAVVSLILSVSALPEARIGVAIDVAILTAFAIAGRTMLKGLGMTMLGAVAFGLGPTNSWAQERNTNEDFTLRIEGPAVVAAGDSTGVLWVIGNHPDVKGTVRDLVIINGTASIDGAVTGNIVLIGSRADLSPSARVGGDVLLYRSDLQTDRGARIAGAVHNEAGVSFGARALWFLWSSVTVALIMMGIGLAYVAGPSLEKAAETITLHKRETGLAALILVLGLPIAAVVSSMTGIGFVLGLLIVFAIIPIVAFAGYFTVGLSVGRRLMGSGRDSRSATTYASVAIGILALQLLTVIPVFGGLILLLSGQIGAGALLYTVWSRGRMVEPARSLANQPA